MFRDINGTSAKYTAKVILSTAVMGWWNSPDVHDYIKDIYYSIKDIIGNLIYLSILIIGRFSLLATLPISFPLMFLFLRHLQKKQEQRDIMNSLKD